MKNTKKTKEIRFFNTIEDYLIYEMGEDEYKKTMKEMDKKSKKGIKVKGVLNDSNSGMS